MSAPKTEIKSIKSSRTDEIFRRLIRLGEIKSEVTIANTEYPGRPRNAAMVAAFHEFGTSRMPARPFLRQALKSPEIAALLADETLQIIHGNRTADTAAQHVAQKTAALAVAAIDGASGWAAPLSPITVAKKGHDRPLRDTLLMRGAVRWRISRKSYVLREGKAVP